MYQLTIAAFLLAAALSSVAAAPARQVAFPPDVQAGMPSDTFDVVGRADPEAVFEFGIALRQHNLDKLSHVLSDVSTPGSSKYGHYLTAAEVGQMLAPPRAAVEPLVAYLKSHGLLVLGNWVSEDNFRVLGSVKSFEAAFSTKAYEVHDLSRGTKHIKVMDSYWLPASVAGVVEFMVGPPQWPVIAPTWRVHPSTIPTSSQDVVVPATLHNQYNTGGRVVTTKAVVGVGEFTNAGISKADLQSFCTGSSVPQAGSKITCQGSCFAASSGSSDGECTLDVQMDASVFINGTIGYYSSNEWLLSVAQMWAKGPAAAVYSISWQTNEQSGGYQMNHRTDVEYQKLGVMGITVVASSGDSGAPGSGSMQLNPGFPSASPYVVCVGATEFVQGSCSHTGQLPPMCKGQGFVCCAEGKEEPADQPAGGFASGGGFSVFETRPSYQAAAVEKYLNDASIPKPPASAFNASNRGYPDVAALGTNNIIYQGGWQLTGGTSASAPIVASIIGLMNDWLLEHGKAPVGFVNPLLYKIAAEAPGGITSIGDLSTNNKDGQGIGYTSNPNGWDPVTGLGTMHLDAILTWMQSNIHLFADW